MRKFSKPLATALAAAFLASCATVGYEPISVSRIGDVLTDARRQITIYQQSSEDIDKDHSLDPAWKTANARGFRCGNGDISFDVNSVQLDLSSSFDATDAQSLGVSAPVSPTAPNGSATASFSNDSGTSGELMFSLYPLHHVDSKHRIPPSEMGNAPIAEVLLALRAALIQSATERGVCFYDYDFRQTGSGDKKAPSGNTFKFAVTVTKDNKLALSAGFSLLTLALSHEEKSVTGNTLTVTFAQRGVPSKLVLDSNQDPKPGQVGGRIGEEMVVKQKISHHPSKHPIDLNKGLLEIHKNTDR